MRAQLTIGYFIALVLKMLPLNPTLTSYWHSTIFLSKACCVLMWWRVKQQGEWWERGLSLIGINHHFHLPPFQAGLEQSFQPHKVFDAMFVVKLESGAI